MYSKRLLMPWGFFLQLPQLPLLSTVSELENWVGNKKPLLTILLCAYLHSSWVSCTLHGYKWNFKAFHYNTAYLRILKILSALLYYSEVLSNVFCVCTKKNILLMLRILWTVWRITLGISWAGDSRFLITLSLKQMLFQSMCCSYSNYGLEDQLCQVCEVHQPVLCYSSYERSTDPASKWVKVLEPNFFWNFKCGRNVKNIC